MFFHFGLTPETWHLPSSWELGFLGAVVAIGGDYSGVFCPLAAVRCGSLAALSRTSLTLLRTLARLALALEWCHWAWPYKSAASRMSPSSQAKARQRKWSAGKLNKLNKQQNGGVEVRN